MKRITAIGADARAAPTSTNMKTATATEAIVDTPSTKTTSSLTGQLHSYPHRYFGDGGGSGVIAQLQRLDHGQPVLAPVEVRVVAVDLEQLTSGAPARLGAHESVRKGTPTGAESVLHPHTYREATQAERDATTIANQNALIRQLERRVRAQVGFRSWRRLSSMRRSPSSPRSSVSGRLGGSDRLSRRRDAIAG